MVDKSHKVDWKGLTVDATDFTVGGVSVTAGGGTEQINTLNVGASGTVGTINAYPATASKGRIRIVPTNNTGDTILDITNALQGQATTLTIPDVGAATGTFSLIEKAETFSGVKTFSANPVLAAAKTIKSNVATATLSSNAATVTNYITQVTTEALTTASGASQAFTITLTGAAATDIAFVTSAGGTNTKLSLSWKAVMTTDTCTVTVTNISGSNLDGTLKFNLWILKA